VDEEDVDLGLVCAHGGSVQRRWPYGSITTSFIEYGTTSLLIVQDVATNEISRSPAEVMMQEHAGH
jgi:hypothetical protein